MQNSSCPTHRKINIEQIVCETTKLNLIYLETERLDEVSQDNGSKSGPSVVNKNIPINIHGILPLLLSAQQFRPTKGSVLLLNNNFHVISQ